MPKVRRYPVTCLVQQAPGKGFSDHQAQRLGAMVADEILALGVSRRDDTWGIEIRGMVEEGKEMTPDTLFHAFMLMAQTIGQMPEMPMEQRQAALKLIHHWQRHTAPPPVNPGQPC